ncbi:MAG: hypothetical protein QOE11_2830 [Solirubrobacteraceae bacterium]|jgi:hypothetical protein|nr:hypothetical protein [Solirubrobacteraceae bacterium]
MLGRIVLGVLAAGLLATVILVATGQIAPVECRTTQTLVARTAPALERRFQLAELHVACNPLAPDPGDLVEMTLTAPTAYATPTRLRSAIRARLTAMGWRPARATGARARDLAIRQDGYRYTATVAVKRISPPLAFVKLFADKGHLDMSLWRVKGRRHDHYMTQTQQLRFLPATAFLPAFVPPGYSRWDPLVVSSFDDASSNLISARHFAPDLAHVMPQLRTGLRPPGDHRRPCEPHECVPWGRTRAGIEVYIQRDKEAADGLGDTAAAVVDGSLFELMYIHNRPDLRPPVSPADVLRIFDSLKPQNTPAR